MKPSRPMNRYQTKLPGDFTVCATESTMSKNHQWVSNTFKVTDVRMMADGESEYDLPNEDENEQPNYNYEYEISPSLEDLQHMNICPAKPINMTSVYADKRCSPMKPLPFYSKDSLPTLPRPQATYKQGRGRNMQRDKNSCDSQVGLVAEDKFLKQPSRPLPRLPSILPKEIKPPPLEAKHSYVSSAHNKSLHSIIMAPVTQSETDIGCWIPMSTRRYSTCEAAPFS
ncbi:uncharacterized protein LOC116979671 [Amblyraja radiata]|uniref:uncharacterized protein LOC116979671 n=1 Tax=Amblyraja radiata TaxID=386614 RepID=UPI0014040CCD|nr:uncharacterized protein LOC116979671 [Amblyraja radiata]